MNTPAPAYTSLSCPRCGAPLPQLAEQVTCSYCQAWYPTLNRIWDTAKVDPAFKQRVQQISNQMAQGMLELSNRFMPWAMNRSRQISEQNDQLWNQGLQHMHAADQAYDQMRAQSDSWDRIQDRWVKTMRGTEDYYTRISAAQPPGR